MGTAGICGLSVSLLTATPVFADETGGTGGTGEPVADGCDVSGVNYVQSDTFPQIANADEIGEYSACDEALISFFEQGEDAIGTSAAKKVMIQATEDVQLEAHQLLLRREYAERE